MVIASKFFLNQKFICCKSVLYKKNKTLKMRSARHSDLAILAECVMFGKVFFAARHFRVASPPANCSKNLPQPHTLPRQRVLLVVIFSKSESRDALCTF